MRLLLFIILAYVCYRVLKGLWGKSSPKFQDSPEAGNISEMVQDPFCKTFVHVKEAKRLTVRGQEYFFCSQECADKFLEKLEEEP